MARGEQGQRDQRARDAGGQDNGRDEQRQGSGLRQLLAGATTVADAEEAPQHHADIADRVHGGTVLAGTPAQQIQIDRKKTVSVGVSGSVSLWQLMRSTVFRMRKRHESDDAADTLKRYEQYAREIAELIESQALKPGSRLPSVRQASAQRRISPSTVFQAYYLLEARGLISSRPRSGYYVNA